nr:TlpA disulfide reductase family protein [Pedobacter panaciterrae]
MKNSTAIKFVLLCSLCFGILRADAKNVTISGEIGQIQHQDPSVFIDKSISIVYYDGIGKLDRLTAKIQTGGKFSFRFPITYTQIILIQSGSGYFTEALVSPGENIKMVIKYQRCEINTAGYPAIHYKPDFDTSFKGTGAKGRNMFVHLRMRLRSTMDSLFSNADLHDGVSFNDYLGMIPKFTKDFFLNHPQYDQAYLPFVRQEISYTLINKRMNLMPDSSSAADFKTIRFPKIQYFSNEVMNAIRKVQTVPNHKNREFSIQSILSNPRLHFAKEEQELIRKSFSSTLSATDSIAVRKLSECIKKDPAGMASIDSVLAISECRYFFGELPSDIAEILTARKVVELKSDLNNNFSYSIFLDKITNPELLSFLRNKLKAKKTFKYVNYKKNAEASIIEAIVKEFPNQHVYIDVWATWCAPCRAEFPYYPNIIEKYMNDVVFVLLCVSSEEQLYKEILGKLPFKAHHYFLDDNQYTNLKNEFNITGIPHYIFINKSRKISNNFSRPSNLEGLQKEIDDELKTK